MFAQCGSPDHSGYDPLNEMISLDTYFLFHDTRFSLYTLMVAKSVDSTLSKSGLSTQSQVGYKCAKSFQFSTRVFFQFAVGSPLF